MDTDSHSGHLVDGATSILSFTRSASAEQKSGVGQGSGEEHIRMKTAKAEERKPLSRRVARSEEPAPAFDEFGNPAFRPEKENDSPAPII